MKARLLTCAEKLHTSFWFVPSLMIVGSILLSIFTLRLDRQVDEQVVNSLPLVFHGGVEGARSLLSAVAGAMITVTGVTFSVMIVAFTLASSQFTPRLLRGFMRDLGNQTVLGVFIANFTFCLAILRVVGGPADEFIPRISVTAALALTAVSVCAMVYFIHHASAIIQAQSIIADVGRELDLAIATLYPEEIGHPARAITSPADLPDDFLKRCVQVPAEQNDYLEAIDGEGLLRGAEEQGLVLSIEVRPGDFIGAGEPLLLAYPTEKVTDDVRGQLYSAFIFGPQRTQTQDPEFVLNELVEIAVRALSLAINDPGTAVLCIDRLGAALAHVAERPAPSSHRYGAEGCLRIVAKHYGFRGLFDAAFNQIRQHGRTSVAVTIRLLEAFRRIAYHIRRPEDRETVLRHAGMVERGSREGLHEPLDREDVQERYRAVLAVLDRFPLRGIEKEPSSQVLPS
ncbi:MAG TPA: DUF2254 domain-containing protein [Chthoniobacteraceae bacterium]|jgi:uncharacterized membrane protein